MSAHSHHPPDPDSADQPHCLWPAAPVGKRIGAVSLSQEGGWWR